MQGWARRTEQGWLLFIQAQPGAKRSEVVAVVPASRGEALKIRIAAPPIEGRANEELEAFIGRALGVPRRSVAVVKGDSSRVKTVLVASPHADPERLLPALS
jgi:uncharacterized protein (TIGR00251 family)